jgi:hypothetical protein
MDVTKMSDLGWEASVTSTEAVRVATRRYLNKESKRALESDQCRLAAVKPSGGHL